MLITERPLRIVALYCRWRLWAGIGIVYERYNALLGRPYKRPEMGVILYLPLLEVRFIRKGIR